MFISDAICLVSDHLPVDIFRLSVSNSTIVSDFILTKLSNTPQLFLLRRLNLSCYFLMIVLMTVSNFFLLMNKELFARLKSPTTFLRFAFGVGYKVQMLKVGRMLIESTNVQPSTKATLTQNACCRRFHYYQCISILFSKFISNVNNTSI